MHVVLSKRGQSITTHRFFLLFVFLLASLILYPYAEESRFSYYALRVLGSAVILLSVYAAGFRRTLLILALLLAVPAVLQRLMVPTADRSALAVASILLSFVFDIFIVVVLFRHVFSRHEADSETVFGALCIYLLIGFSFASVYNLLTDLHPNAFYMDPLVNPHTVPNRFDFVYYSFGTITSLGASGIVAVLPQARSFTVLEAILGVLYLAVLIARLMGAYRSTPPR
jgi:Ion channel